MCAENPGRAAGMEYTEEQKKAGEWVRKISAGSYRGWKAFYHTTEWKRKRKAVLKRDRLAVYDFALHSGINIIANALSMCEVRTFRKWEEIREEQYYRWNYEPNAKLDKKVRFFRKFRFIIKMALQIGETVCAVRRQGCEDCGGRQSTRAAFFHTPKPTKQRWWSWPERQIKE